MTQIDEKEREYRLLVAAHPRPLRQETKDAT
jgi:hypothetical protein